MIPGIFTSDSGPMNSRPVDPLPHAMLETGRMEHAPLYSMTAGMGSEEVCHTVVSWEDTGEMDYNSYVTGNCEDPQGTTLEISNPGPVTENLVFMVPETGELLLVTGVSGCYIRVKRGFGCSPKCDILAGCELVRISTTFEENSDPPQGHYGNPIPQSNLTMIVRTAWEASGTALANCYNFGDLQNHLQQHALTMHAQDKEKALLFMRRAHGHKGNRPWRTFDGIDAQLPQNRLVSPMSGTDKLVIDLWLQKVYANNIKGQPNERIFLGSNSAVAAINSIATSSVQQTVEFGNMPSAKKHSFIVTSYETIYGSIKVFRHPCLTGRSLGSRIYALHPAAIKMFHMRGRSNMVQNEGSTQEGNGSARGLRDGRISVITSEFSVAYRAPITGGVLTNVMPLYSRT